MSRATTVRTRTLPAPAVIWTDLVDADEAGRGRRAGFTTNAAILVIDEKKPSAFFGTPVAAHRVERGADTVIVVAGSTSNGVRATEADVVRTDELIAALRTGLGS